MPGVKGRSGRKSKAEEFGLAALLDRVWSIPDREQVIRVLHDNAIKGNERAASILLAYAYGKPTERIEHHIQLKQAGEEWLRFKADFGSPEIDEAELLAVFAEIKQLPPELISEQIQ